MKGITVKARDTIPKLNGIPACEHPDFPLKLRRRIRNGHDQSEWVKKIRKVRIGFGTVYSDPTGEKAWRCYLAEETSWRKKQNPRAAFRLQHWFKTFGRWRACLVVSGPLARIGVVIVDARHGIFSCIKCNAKWRIKFKEGRYVLNRMLKCPKGCYRSGMGEIRNSPCLKQIKEALLYSAHPELIPPTIYARHRKAIEDAWRALPPSIDLQAELEGIAIENFPIKFKFTRRQQRRWQIALSSELRTDEYQPPIEIKVPAMHERHQRTAIRKESSCDH